MDPIVQFIIEGIIEKNSIIMLKSVEKMETNEYLRKSGESSHYS